MGGLAHFDCILEDLKKSNELSEKEKIVYLGGGTFGIIEETEPTKDSSSRFFVRKRINYEDRKNKKIRDLDIDLEEEDLFNV